MQQQEKRIVPLLVVLFDQLFKFFALRLNLATINYGLGWGIFSSSFTQPLFLIFIILGSLFIINHLFPKYFGKATALELIIGGGFSNLIDRVFRGGVVDYLHLPLIPSFNLADFAITVGFLVLFKEILPDKGL
jgi:signal peptidase II